jgi:hypothetical protein
VAKNRSITAQLSRLSATLAAWFDNNIIGLTRQMRLSYLPPLMVYMAAGISGLTGIVGTFFIKDYLDLPAEFLAMLGFWAGLPRALKMPLGHQGRTVNLTASSQDGSKEKVRPNWWILGGSLAFVVFTLTMGLLQIPYNQEIIFTGSMAIVLFLMAKQVKELSPAARRTLVGTAIVIFVFRAIPGPGAGASWWQIDELGFDQQFISRCSPGLPTAPRHI